MIHDVDRVVVLGAGGRTGRLVIDAAIDRGIRAVAVVRSPERAQLDSRVDLDIVSADARDAESLRKILQPRDVVVSAIGPSGRRSNGLYTEVAHAVVSATAHVDDAHFVGVTSSGVYTDDPNHPWWYRTFLVPVMRESYADMARMESIVASSRLSWTFVRPGRLLDEPAGVGYRIEDGFNPRKGISVSRADLANFVVECAVNDAWGMAYPTIAR